MKNFLVDFFGWEDFDHGLFRVLCDENWEGGGGGKGYGRQTDSTPIRKVK